ncbi:unnamed protein product [Protopolystoma xenopodis]|uniref:Uncharacterized protein n=1 Tax=Protopolystoma xenopodis TaxID=117903 RepID=A0A3S5CLC4_9PLAT|nr:unnamed protein product [Protopolystoma xenopodis]
MLPLELHDLGSSMYKAAIRHESDAAWRDLFTFMYSSSNSVRVRGKCESGVRLPGKLGAFYAFCLVG